MSEKFFNNFNLKMPILQLYLNETFENLENSQENSQGKKNVLICDSNTHYSFILEKISNFYENP